MHSMEKKENVFQNKRGFAEALSHLKNSPSLYLYGICSSNDKKRYYMYGGHEWQKGIAGKCQSKLMSFSPWNQDRFLIEVEGEEFAGRRSSSTLDFRFKKGGIPSVVSFGGWLADEFTNELLEFDLISKKWSKWSFSGDVPLPLAYHETIYQKRTDKMFIFGGVKSPGENPITGEWRRTNNMFQCDFKKKAFKKFTFKEGEFLPKERSGLSMCWMTSKEEKFIIFGGRHSEKLYLKDCAIFCTVTMKWIPVRCSGSVPSRRSSHSAVVFDGSLFVYGGGSDTFNEDGEAENEYHNDMFELNLTTFVWKKIDILGDLKRPGCYGHKMGSFVDTEGNGCVFIHGGVSKYGSLPNIFKVIVREAEEMKVSAEDEKIIKFIDFMTENDLLEYEISDPDSSFSVKLSKTLLPCLKELPRTIKVKDMSGITQLDIYRCILGSKTSSIIDTEDHRTNFHRKLIHLYSFFAQVRSPPHLMIILRSLERTVCQDIRDCLSLFLECVRCFEEVTEIHQLFTAGDKDYYERKWKSGLTLHLCNNLIRCAKEIDNDGGDSPSVFSKILRGMNIESDVLCNFHNIKESDIMKHHDVAPLLSTEYSKFSTFIELYRHRNLELYESLRRSRKKKRGDLLLKCGDETFSTHRDVVLFQSPFLLSTVSFKGVENEHFLRFSKITLFEEFVDPTVLKALVKFYYIKEKMFNGEKVSGKVLLLMLLHSLVFFEKELTDVIVEKLRGGEYEEISGELEQSLCDIPNGKSVLDRIRK